MFVEFDEVFNSKPLPQTKLPDAFISYLNKQLPSGFKYVTDDDGNCIITTDGTSFTLGGFEYKITAEDKAILGKNYTQEDILNLFYNRQKPIPLRLAKEGYVLLNGEEFPVEKMFLNPHSPIRADSGKFFMAPSPFPAPFTVKVGGSGYERSILVHRVPHNSINTAAFESEETSPIKICYFVDQSAPSLSMAMSLHLANVKSVRDIVESTRICNAYLNGEGSFCGQPLLIKITGDSKKNFEESGIEFWEKVLKIEEYLGIAFTPPMEDIDFDTICLVESLYQNLIERTPIRDSRKPDSLNGNWESDNEIDLESHIGSQIYFEFEATKIVELFEAKITLYGLVGILDAILDDIVRKGKKYKMMFKDVSDEKPRHTVSLYFKEEAEMRAYKATDHNERIKAFYDAKKAREYLTVE